MIQPMLPFRHLPFKLVLTTLAVLCASNSFSFATGQTPDELDARLNEQVIKLPVGSWPHVDLQVTVLHPDGPGPFPVALLNHGKDHGLPSDEPRYRSVYAARYFLSRGYAVVLPMMRGFAGSGGKTWVHGCDLEAIGTEQAKDIRDVIEALPRSIAAKWLDVDRIVISGQSMGGWVALAAGALNIPGVKGLVNFAGGLQAPNCLDWQDQLAIGAEHYGAGARVPSIWFYGDNDGHFPPTIWRAMAHNYSQGRATVSLIDYGRFEDDSHNFLGHIEALPIWTPKLDNFLAQLNLPNQNLHPELLPPPYPQPTGFADINEVSAIPLIGDKGRDDYKTFLKKPMPRTFVIASNGSSVYTDGGYDPLERAFALCQQHTLHCQVYAIDDEVVWPKPLPLPAATHFADVTDIAAVPYLNAGGRQGYQRFLTLPVPRAFVIAADGAWSFSSRDFDVLSSALRQCSAKHQNCVPYAVNDQVVWAAGYKPPENAR